MATKSALTQKVEDSIEELEQAIDDLKLMISTQEKEIRSLQTEKVDWKHFIWIVGVLMTIVLGLFGVIYAKLDGVDVRTFDIQKDVSQVQGFIRNADVK
jgi:hypothetical protein